MTIPSRSRRALGLAAAAAVVGAACGSEEPAPSPPAAEDRGPWEEVVTAERAFAAAARTSGGRDAFLQYIDSAGVLFRPGPVNGRSALEAGPEFPGLLEWDPAVAGVSADGALGFTTGPWVLSAEGETGTGRYVTLWRRGPDGAYRFVLDVGVPGPGPPVVPDSTGRVRRARVTTTVPDTVDRPLLAADSAMRAGYRDGAVALGGLAFPAWLQVLRPEREAQAGPAPLLSAVVRAADRGGVEWEVAGSATSPDGTLGYVYGMATWAEAGASGEPPMPFLRIWGLEEDGGWQLLVDLLGLPGA